MRRVWKFAESDWIGVAGGGDAGSRGHQLAEHPRHHHGVARIVELEFVDADQGGALQELHRTRIAEGADQGRVLDERAEVLGAGRFVPERGEEVRLADAETAVEVDARLHRLHLLAAAAEQPGRSLRLPRLGEELERGHGLRLRRVVVVGAVGVEGGVLELRRRHQARGDLGAGDLRRAVGEAGQGSGRLEGHGGVHLRSSWLCRKYLCRSIDGASCSCGTPRSLEVAPREIAGFQPKP